MTSEFHLVAIMSLNLARMSSEGKKCFHEFIQVHRNLYINIWTLQRNKIFRKFKKYIFRRKKRIKDDNSDAYALTSPLESRFGYPGHREPDTASSKKCIFFPQCHLMIWIVRWTILVITSRNKLSYYKLSLRVKRKCKLTGYTELHHLLTYIKIKFKE